MALIMSALMLAVIVAPLAFSVPHELCAVDTGERHVKYYYDSNKNISVDVTYYGIASAEYNPYNNLTFGENPAGINGWVGEPITVSNPEVGVTIYFSNTQNGTITLPDKIKPIINDGKLVYDVNYNDDSDVKDNPKSVNVVNGNQLKIELPTENYLFWTAFPSGSITVHCTYEGDVNTNYVFAGWSEKPVEVDYRIDESELIEPGDILGENVQELYAVWYTPNIQSLITAELEGKDSSVTAHFEYVKDHRNIGEDTFSLTKHEGCAYTEIILLSGANKTGDYLKMGTYRSANLNDKADLYIDELYNRNNHDYHIPIGGNVIIDNINLLSGAAGIYEYNHGNSAKGLFANGYKLIIGTGVETGDSSNPRDYPQIFGGNSSSNHSAPVDRDISSTNVVIFSGTYYNIIAGNYDGSITGDTRLVIRGDTTVLDTVVGGNSSNTRTDTISNTWIYVLGGCLPGDSYQEDQLGKTGYTKGVTLTESTILTGGSNNSQVTGSTNVFISGTAKLWDVQGGGRRGVSGVGTANVEVSGQAAIRHVLCGSITDGLERNGTATPNIDSYDGSVKDVNITIEDNAMVASVFGAGYDTYYAPHMASMLKGGDITINIDGGTIGYVYGGGYRGAIGYTGFLDSSPQESPLDSIQIKMTGGTVLYDIFGGGRGGVDKFIHSDDTGTESWSNDHSGQDDTTGYAWTCVRSISIDISGGTVKGDVYGGGQSIGSIFGKRSQAGVAKVTADTITIDVSGGNVGGSVYGGGKGVSSETAGSSLANQTLSFIIEENEESVYSFDEMSSFPAYKGINGADTSNGNYGSYAQVGQSGDGTSISISVSATVGNGNASVFGAGAIATTYAQSIDLDLSGTLKGGVYGGGESAKAHISGGITIDLLGGSKVNGDIYGAGMYGYTDVNGITISLGDGSSAQAKVVGNVYGGGLGLAGQSSLDSNRTIMMNNARVEGSIFGGTRDGNDGLSALCESNIYLIFGTVTKNVYGGGFQGTSYLNSNIYFGTPAFEEIDPDRYTPVGLRVGSIYGGSYYDTSQDRSDASSGMPSLLQGSSIISIGSRATGTFNGYSNVGGANAIAITGDVFGQGSFSTIEGTATVTVDGYRQETTVDDDMIMSFQGIDTLSFIDSTVSLHGSSQGGVTYLTEMMTLNDIGYLIMQGSSEIILYAEMNAVDSYSSYVSDEVYSTEADFASGACGNTIRLMDGSVAMVLGPKNTGKDDNNKAIGIIRGYTLLEREDGEDYYGAFATGSSSTAEGKNPDAGFLIRNGDGYALASVLVDGDIKVWYIAGATTIERTLTFSGSKASVSNVNIPKILGSTELDYTGAYIDYNIQDSIYIAIPSNSEDGGAGSGLPEPCFTMNVGGIDIATHSYEDGQWVVSPTGSGTISSNITVESNVHGNPVSVGLLGYVVIHLEEVSVYGSVRVPVHTVDLVIGMYIEPDQNIENLNYKITVVDGVATGYLTLPEMGNIYTYTFQGMNATSVGLQEFTLAADSTYFGRNGWESSPYLDAEAVAADFSGTGMVFGTGGAVSPVVRLHYDGGPIGEDSTATLQFRITTISINGTQGLTYTVTVTLEDAKPVNIRLHYDGVGLDDSTYVLKVSSDGDGRTVLEWVDSTSGNAEGLEVPFNTVVSTYQGSFMVKWPEGSGETVRYYNSLGAALEGLIDCIQPSQLNGGGKFVYQNFFSGWYTDEKMTNQYNLGSYVTQDIDLYAKFGVTVSFDFRNSEPNREIVIPAGTTLHDNGIYNYFELYGNNPIAEPGEGRSVVGLDYFEEKATYEGHYLLNPEGWVASLDVTSGGDGWRYKFDDPMLMNTTLYIMWGVETYDVTIKIDSGTSFDGKFTLAGATGSYSDGEITFSIEYGSTVGLSLGGFCISSMENSNTGVSISYISGDMSATMVFRDAGDNGAEISITMKVTEAIDVTVKFDVVDGFTSDLDGDTLRVTIGGREVTFTSAGSTQMVNIPIGSDVASSVDSSAFDYDVIVWLNGQRFTESSTVQDKDTITIHVSRIVDMMSFDGTGIDHLELQKVVVPNYLNDGWSYAEVEEIYDDDFQNGVYKVHENWRFTIVPEVVGSVPPDYLPSNTYSVSTQEGTIYMVNGNGDVTFIELSSTVTLGLTINLDGADDDNIGNILGWTITFTIDGGSTTFKVTNSTVTGKVTYEKMNGSHAYSCSLPGFQGVSGTLDEFDQDLVLTLYPIEYTVEFLPFDGDNRDSVPVQWTVLDDLHHSEFPNSLYMIDGESEYASSDGMPIVVEIVNGDQPKRFVEWNEEVLAISYSDFDASGIMYLTSVQDLRGDVLPPAGIVIETVVLLRSDLNGGPVEVGILFDRDVTLSMVTGDNESVDVVFSAADQTLTFEEEIEGTGVFIASADGYRLYVYVIADGSVIE